MLPKIVYDEYRGGRASAQELLSAIPPGSISSAAIAWHPVASFEITPVQEEAVGVCDPLFQPYLR